MAPTDWVQWHERYRDAEGALTRRLALVQGLIEEVLDAHEGAPVRVLSLCSGDGRDVLGVLAARKGRDRVSGRLIELDPDIADAAMDAVADGGVTGISVLNADASRTQSFAGAVPADLVLLCGIFGNISNADVERTITALPMLVSPGAHVIWTRHPRPPDLTPALRGWFAGTGFAELAFEADPDGAYAVGLQRFDGVPQRLEPGNRLFTFLR